MDGLMKGICHWWLGWSSCILFVLFLHHCVRALLFITVIGESDYFIVARAALLAY